MTVKAISSFLLPLLLVPALAAQPPEEDAAVADDVFFEKIDVSVVNVEVYVTDKSGQPVTGLEADDFELYEDGERQEITHFYAASGRRPARPELPPGVGVPEEGGPGPEAAAPPPEDRALRLVVFLDNLHVRPTNRNKVVRQVMGFLRRAIREPEDRVMLVTFERSLHIRHPFTGNLDAVSDELRKVEELSSFALERASARRDVMRRIEQSETALEAEGFVDFYAKEEHFDVGLSIGGLEEVVGSLAGLPGRKALLYVSDGLPMTAAEDLYHLLSLRFPDTFSPKLMASQYRSDRRFRELTARANANGVTIYTLEAAGLTTRASLSAEHGSGLADRTFVDVDGIRDFSLEEPLMNMAADTGGIAALNTNDIDGAFARVAEDFETYYSLGYQPVHARQGRYHTIEVKVKGRGLEVRHRTGYRDKVASTKVHEGTLATLLYGPQKNPLDVRVSFGAGKVKDNGQRLVPLEVKIPIGALSLVPREGSRVARLRVAVALIDDDGRVSPVDQNEIPLEIPEAEVEVARTKYFTYAVELLMRPGDHLIAVGVADEYSGTSSFIRQAVRTGS